MRISDWSSDVCSSDLEIPKGNNRQLQNRIPTEDVKSATGKVLAKAGELIDETTARALGDAADDTVAVMPFITEEVTLLDAPEEEKRTEERRVGKESGRTCR